MAFAQSLLIPVLIAAGSLFRFAPATSMELTVRPTDIDVKGHVNNARYVEYLQWGRWEWFDAKGLSNDRLKELGCVLVVVNLNLNYRKECGPGDRLTVRTWPEKIGEKSFTLRQEIRQEDGSIALDGLVTMVAISQSTRKSCPLPDDLRRALSRSLTPGAMRRLADTASGLLKRIPPPPAEAAKN